MRPIIYPYRLHSRSAKLLSTALQNERAKRVRPDGNYRPFRNHLIINWGNSITPAWEASPRIIHNWLNHPAGVIDASNKLSSFLILQEQDLSIPEFTTNITIAQAMVDAGDIVVCRQTLTGHSGVGIGLVGRDIEDGDHTGTVPQAPLYVKYKKKRKEFRVHIFRSPSGELEVIDVQEKRKDRGHQGGINTKIRSHQNGWVFCREGITEPNGLRDLAKEAVEALGLDFGAVDIIWNERENQCYVLEINTAPGVEGATVDKYAEAIRKWL